MITRLAWTEAHEGPVYVAGEDALYFTTVPRDGRVDIRRLALGPGGGISTVRADANMANGMTLDAEGRLVVCEQGGFDRPAAITRMDLASGHVETVVDGWRGLPLNSPNDVVAASDGALWFTDPSYGHLQGFRPAPRLADRVYRFEGELTAVAEGFEKPNGLALSPGERVLYVGDSEARHVKAFDVVDGGRLANERLFCEIADGYPDGIRVDSAGNVYATAAAGIQVFDPAGALVREIPLPGAVHFTFGGPGLLVTTDDAIWAVTTG
ncbi:MAG: SMP-30/gluconolactonase/LRE family protein [Solirubrobacteraceae bacterium]